MVGRILIIGCALALAACSAETSAVSQPSSTLPATTTAATPSTTTTTTPPATIPAFSEIPYPPDPQTVDDLPEILSSLAGAPVPEPDLSIAGPEDMDRWMAEVFNWMAWAEANPGKAADHITALFQISSQAATEMESYWQFDADRQRFGIGWPLEPHDAEIAAGNLEEGNIEVVVGATKRYPRYRADQDGRIIQVMEPVEWPFLVRFSVHQSRDGGWRITKFNTSAVG